MVEGAGHYPHVEVPATTAPFILNSLAWTLDAGSQVLTYKNPTVRRLWQT
jgi:hypothetical protein